MKIALIWATPVDRDPNIYLRPIIEKSFLETFQFESFDSVQGLDLGEVTNFDAVLICGTLLILEPHVEEILRAPQGVPLFFWNFEDPYDHDKTFFWTSKFRHIFTTEFHALPYYSHPQASYLPLAAGARPKFTPAESPKSRVSLVGSNYARRAEVFDSISQDKPSEYELVRVGDVVHRMPRAKYLGRLSNDRIYRLDLESQVTLIIGRDFDFCNKICSVPAGSPGPRFFEALATGINILYDPYTVDFSGNSDLNRFATPFYTTGSIWSLIQQITLNESKERKAIQIEYAMNSQTYNQRAGEIFNTIKDYL
jgi:hypothetical protein